MTDIVDKRRCIGYDFASARAEGKPRAVSEKHPLSWNNEEERQ